MKTLTLSRQGIIIMTIIIGSVEWFGVRSSQLVQSFLLCVIGKIEARLVDIIKEDGDGGSRDLAT